MTDYPEYTLSQPPPCPRNQDHLTSRDNQGKQVTLRLSFWENVT